MARKPTNEYSQEKLLAEIAAAKATVAELRQKRSEALQGHRPQALIEPAKYSAPEIEQARETQRFVDECEQEIQRLEGELRKAWDYFGGLSDSSGRIGVAGEDLEAEIAALTERRRALDRRAGTFREDAHDAINNVVEFHTERIDALLASPLGAGEMQELAAIWSWRDPAFAEALHASVDAREFPHGSRAAWQLEQQTIARQISRRQAELQLRESEQNASEAEAARKAAEAQLAAVGSDAS